MAQKRMFSKDITNSEEFLDMPDSTQKLYFHLGMNADDDGFIQPKGTMRMIGSSDDNLTLLLAKGFLISFNGNVIVITHWKMNNDIKSDRKKDTIYVEHLKTLGIGPNKEYVPITDTKCIQNGDKMFPQYSIGKESIVLASQKKESFSEHMNSLGFEQSERPDADGAPFPVWEKDGKALTPAKEKEMERAWVGKPVRQEDGRVAEILEIWNRYPTVESTGNKNVANPQKNLLPEARMSADLKRLIQTRLRTYGEVQEWEKAIKNYAKDIMGRTPNVTTSYHGHRMSLYDFVLQANGLVKFINR